KLALQHRAACEWLSAGEDERAIREPEALLAELGVKLARTPRGLLVSRALRRALTYLRGYRFATTSAEELSAGELLAVDALYTLSTALASREPARAAEVQLRHLDASLTL